MRTKPVLSIQMATTLHKLNHADVLEKISMGSSFYSQEHSQFLTHIEEWDSYVAHPAMPSFPLMKEEVIFELAPYSSVYEVRRLHGAASSILLADNFASLVEQHMDITPETEFLILDSLSSPILLGITRVIDRLTINVSDGKFFRGNVENFLEERASNV